jgi:zinc transport system substrate-binding protein
MNRKVVAIIIGVVLALGFFAVVLYFAIQQNEDEDEGLVHVVVSIAPQKEFAEALGGDKVSVTVMVPPGQEPHDFEPTTSQMKDVAKADIYFKVGSGVEFETVWMGTFEKQNENMRVVDGSKGVELIPMEYEHDHNEEEHNGSDHDDEHDHEEGMDPHIWMSPKNAKVMVQNLLVRLKAEDPANSHYFQENADAYLAELDRLVDNISAGLEPFQGEKFLVYHPAFGYFAHDFGLVQLAIEEEGKEPTPKGLEHVIEQAEEEGIKVVFEEPQFDKHNAQTIADEIGGGVITLDPLAENYLDNIKEISDKLIEAFENG